MSKRIKLKFKKILKKAEFVHADLEYHEELFEDAKEEFNLAFTSIVDSLDKEARDTFEKLREKEMNDRIAEIERRNKEAAEAAAERDNIPEEDKEGSGEGNQNRA